MDGDWGGGDDDAGVVVMGLNRTSGMSARSWARNSSLRRNGCVSPHPLSRQQARSRTMDRVSLHVDGIGRRTC